MSAQGWPRLRQALVDGSCPGVLDWARATGEQERRAAFNQVAAYLREHPATWEHFQQRAGVRAAAIAATASTAKKAAAALRQGELRWMMNSLSPQPVLELLRLREVPWQGELAHVLAERLPADETSGPRGDWVLVAELVRESGCAVPAAEGFVGGWIDHVRGQADADGALRGSPFTRELVPQLFAHDRLGGRLDYTYQGSGFLPALIRLAADDAGVRAALLDGCRARLLRGGRPTELRPYTRMHEELAPTGAEAAEAVADYRRLLETGSSPLAGLAQRMLRAADEAGLLDPYTLVEICATALARPEKGLVKAQTVWLRRAARARPELAAQLLALLDGGPDTAAPPPVALPAPVPAPIDLAPGSVYEVAEDLAAITAGDRSMATVERFLAGLVAWRSRDHDALIRAIGPQLDSARAWWPGFAEQLHEALLSAVLARGRSERWREMLNVFRSEEAVQGMPLRLLRGSSGSPARMYAVRLAEISAQLIRRPVPLLTATPTHANGAIAPEVLLERLTRAEREGWQPWRIDLDQALLRLPRTVAPQVVAAAAALTSPAGVRFAQWISMPTPDPVTVVRDEVAGPHVPAWHQVPQLRRTVALAPPDGVAPVVRELFQVYRYELTTWRSEPVTDPQLWTSALPSHPEVVAAWAVHGLASLADQDAEGGALLLPLLAECDGPAGPSVHLALAYTLGSRAVADRVAAVDGLLGFAATGAVDFTVVGAEIGRLGAAGMVKPNRVAAALAEATQAGACQAVWEIVAAALPPLVAEPKARPGTADLMALAHRCAAAVGVRQVPAALTEVAARPGSSRLVAEARTLRALVSPR
ncbi:hypothetical protein Cs7R123_27870 [Catellatospora sp. TT07R-123]|uniref:DUF7824 domain-containing protein n=1 Tax=Catellatospora sp. TT07R-123 TaxID=2733863 RepID=UPI001B28F7F5|nr:DUF6493 family protein [Catellatospora sp. TT07R-123]GHJ45445.1 hypothetical protein Cs7R123_27870 [Catellatospora sp. TT07R-123]